MIPFPSWRPVSLATAAALLAALALSASPAEAQGRYAGQSRLPTGTFVAANPAPAGAAVWRCKTDCVVKLETIAEVRAPEPPPALPAMATNGGYRVPNNLVKRTRTAVEDAVFESLDKSDRAKGYKYKVPDGTRPKQ
jgi:hypothetical protein